MKKVNNLLGFICLIITVYLSVIWKDLAVFFVTIISTIIFMIILLKLLDLFTDDEKKNEYLKIINVLFLMFNFVWFILCIVLLLKQNEYSGQIYMFNGLFIFYLLFNLKRKRG